MTVATETEKVEARVEEPQGESVGAGCTAV